MHSQSLLVLLYALFSLASLSAADIQKRSFAVERVKNPNFTGRNGPRALVKTYRKFNMALPQGLLDAMAAQEKEEAAAVQQKRDTKRPFKYLGRSEAHRRGLVDGLLTGLGLDNGNQKGAGQNGGQDGGGQAGGGNGGNRGGNRGGRNGNQNGNVNLGNGNGNGNRGNLTNAANSGNRNGGSRNNNGSRTHGNARNTTAQAPFNNNNNNNNATNQVGSVPAVPAKNDVEFISPVKIGGQTVNLDFDTGSSDLWVFNKQLDPALTANHRVFDAAKSASFRPMQGATFRITYGDGSGAEGNVGTDVVDVGGASFADQAVELATAVSPQFVRDLDSDGLMGLAFSQTNTVKPQRQRTFFDNVKADLAEPVFAADLRKNAPGTYSFGSVDRSRFQGELTWIPVNTTRGFWQFGSERFAVGNGGQGGGQGGGGQVQASTSGGQAIADTGTTLILADEKVVTAYYAQVQGAQNNAQVGGFTFPCNANLPDLALDVGNVYMAKISGNDINFAQVGDGTCFGGVQATPPGQLGIYGDIFFKSQFVVFNAGNNTLGMAPHA